MSLQENDQLLNLMEKIYDHFAAVYMIDVKTERYQRVKTDAFLEQLLGEAGDLEFAYKMLFQSINGSRSGSKYDAFIYKKVFAKDGHSGNINLSDEGAEHYYDYRVFALDEEVNVLLMFESRSKMESDQIEKLKMDTIQENYLFSMYVDLKNDTLRNSVTTEISAGRQDYMELKYSDWRYMIANMFLPDDRTMFLQISDPKYLIEHLEKEKNLRYEVQMQNMKGEYVWVRLMFNRMNGFSRENPLLVYTVQDIHEDMMRLLQQENIVAAVEEQNQKLSDINKAKSVFISNMSHEIRTPINAVLGMDEMILRSTDDKQIQSYAYDIKNAGKMLLSIINDILDYSKIEAGKMEIIPVEYHLGYMLDDINSMISVKAKEKDLEYITDISPNLPSIVYGDELRIKQIMINILTNAVKYTPTGSVTFSIREKESSDEQVALEVSVTDTGIGMKPEDLGKLFTDFQRLEEKRNRNIEGTGLGMSIVVRLLEQMNSKLEVQSVYGEGSTFSFVLALPVVDAAPIGDMRTIREKRILEDLGNRKLYAPRARILAVDDNQTNLFVLEGLLEKTGIQVDCAINGKRALKMLQANHYDLVLLDHLMPVMDGIETLGHIRDLGADYEELPVVALTANVSSDSRQRYKGAGFTDYLEKPIVVSELERVLFTYLPQDLLE